MDDIATGPKDTTAGGAQDLQLTASLTIVPSVDGLDVGTRVEHDSRGRGNIVSVDLDDECNKPYVCLCLCARACLCARVCSCVRACARACVRVCARTRSMGFSHGQRSHTSVCVHMHSAFKRFVTPQASPFTCGYQHLSGHAHA